MRILLEDFKKIYGINMSAKILRFQDYTPKPQTREESESRATTRAFMRRVDMNLININAFGYDYLVRITDWVYKTIWAGGDVCTNVDYILRVEYHVQSCNLHECMDLLEKIDAYLATPTIATSLEKPFMLHVRNKVFQRAELLKSYGLRNVSNA